jgi:hypothetical protein
MSLIDGTKLHRHLTRQADGWHVSYLSSCHDDFRLILLQTNTPAHLGGEQINKFIKGLQQCRICLLGNGELAILPASVRINDTVCIFANTDSPCALRADGKGHWTLVSGDCYVMGDVSVLALNHGTDALHEYIRCNQNQLEDFLIR